MGIYLGQMNRLDLGPEKHHRRTHRRQKEPHEVLRARAVLFVSLMSRLEGSLQASIDRRLDQAGPCVQG